MDPITNCRNVTALAIKVGMNSLDIPFRHFYGPADAILEIETPKRMLKWNLSLDFSTNLR